jgi:hypothetical protein
MAGELNVTIVGNLADDPELRYTQGGLAVVSVAPHGASWLKTLLSRLPKAPALS